MKKYRAAGIICALACVLLLLLLIVPRLASKPFAEQVPQVLDEYENDSSASGKSSADEPYVSPIDFESLQKDNADIYAWLDIPGTEISYPIVQNEDDSYYLNHDITGAYKTSGAIFTESAYNRNDFSDPVTVVYGHKMKAGTMFGKLQDCYWDPESFAQHKTVIVYLPDRALHFEVFLAAQYSDEHLLYDRDYSDREQKKQLIERIRNTHQIGGCFDENAELTYDEPLLILSTCLKGNLNNRCLVVAKEIKP